MMSPNGVATIREHIRYCDYATVLNHGLGRKNNLNIDVHDGISPEPPKVIIIKYYQITPTPLLSEHLMTSVYKPACLQGLHFLSERSQHRVEGSDRAAQADLESLLIELNLL